MKIGKYLELSQITYSKRATELKIENNPTAEQLKYITDTVINIFDKLVDHFGIDKISINSGFRGALLNSKTPGSSSTSQHCANKGFAFDLEGKNGLTNKELFDYIKTNLVFDQLIYEFGNMFEPDWVHVSYYSLGNRKQVLKSIKNKENKTEYQVYKA